MSTREMLRRNGKARRKQVKALTDPKPEFVSLVNAGANKTPFRAIRNAIGAEAVREDAFAIARIEFDEETFKSESDVAEWLVAGGYDGASIQRTESGYTVAGEYADDTDLTEISGEGFRMYVADVTPGTNSQKSDDDRSEVRKKLDVALTDATNFTIGNMPAPSLMEMTWALYNEVREKAAEGDTDAALAAATDFTASLGELLGSLPGDSPTQKAFIDAIAPEVEMTKETETAAQVEDEVVADAAVETTEEVAQEEAAEEGDTAAPEVTADAEEAQKDDEVADAEADAPVAEEEAPAPEAVAAEESEEEAVLEEAAKSDDVDPLAQLAKMVGDLTASVSTLTETVSKSADETKALAQRVEAVEDSRQTRKGADVDETTTSKSATKTISEEMSEMRTKSMLGIRN